MGNWAKGTSISQKVSSTSGHSVLARESQDYEETATSLSSSSLFLQCVMTPKALMHPYGGQAQTLQRRLLTEPDLSEQLRITILSKRERHIYYITCFQFSHFAALLSAARICPFYQRITGQTLCKVLGKQTEHSWELINDGFNQLISMLFPLSESQSRHISGSSSSSSSYIFSLHLHYMVSNSWLLYKMFAHALIKKDLSGWAHDGWRTLSPLARPEYLNSSLMLLLSLFIRGH